MAEVPSVRIAGLGNHGLALNECPAHGSRVRMSLVTWVAGSFFILHL
jgi:hypothetical protein